MSREISVRRATESDRDFVVGLVPSLLAFGSPVSQDAENLIPGFGSVLAEAVSAQDSRSTVLIAQGIDTTRLGFISLKVREDVTGAERAHVADLAVVPSARRMGVGTALMEAAESWSRERGLPVLSLDVWATNDAAMAFYRRLGYSAESVCMIKQLD